MRGVDLLLGRKGIDPQRIILLGRGGRRRRPGSSDGGARQADHRGRPLQLRRPAAGNDAIRCPPNAEQTFNYFGGGSWESTRNISRSSAATAMLPWVIVGSVAPRRLVYAHEFAWDQEHDPVWKRLQTIYGFYDAAENLASTHGEGGVRGSGAGNTHCTNIGPIHRVAIDEAFLKWFKIEKPSHDEMPHRKPDELACFTADLKPTPPHALLAKRASERLDRLQAGIAKALPQKTGCHARRWVVLLVGGPPSARGADCRKNAPGSEDGKHHDRAASRLKSSRASWCRWFCSNLQVPTNPHW